MGFISLVTPLPFGWVNNCNDIRVALIRRRKVWNDIATQENNGLGKEQQHRRFSDKLDYGECYVLAARVSP